MMMRSHNVRNGMFRPCSTPSVAAALVNTRPISRGASMSVKPALGAAGTKSSMPVVPFAHPPDDAVTARVQVATLCRADHSFNALLKRHRRIIGQPENLLGSA